MAHGWRRIPNITTVSSHSRAAREGRIAHKHSERSPSESNRMEPSPEALFHAIGAGDLPAVRDWWARNNTAGSKFDMDLIQDEERFGSPLTLACYLDHLHITRFLIDACGVDVNRPTLGSAQQTALHIACGSGYVCLLYTSPSPRDLSTSRMPSSA